ncbi:hypothetical protein GCM10027432_28470 [Lysobacter fragariae]
MNELLAISAPTLEAHVAQREDGRQPNRKPYALSKKGGYTSSQSDGSAEAAKNPDISVNHV